jgi:hypothetical protein
LGRGKIGGWRKISLGEKLGRGYCCRVVSSHGNDSSLSPGLVPHRTLIVVAAHRAT